MLPWHPILDAKSAILATYLHSSLWHSETDCNIAIPISKDYMSWIFLHRVEIWWDWVQQPRVYAVKMTTFAAIGQKSAYHAKYLRTSWTDLYQLYWFGKHMCGNDYPDIRLAVAQRTLLYGNQLNLGAVCRLCHKRPLLCALTFDNGFDNREAAFKRLIFNNSATSCTNLVSDGLTISEFTLLKRAIFAATRPQFDDRLSFSTLVDGLNCRNFDFRIVIGNHFCTSYRNLVRFESATPEFKTYSWCRKFCWGDFSYVH